jgi:glycosyltransferase involved in cell wall biosynthesis
MRHVALVIPGLDRIGGAERQVILLAAGLVQRGWRVSVVALSGAGGSSAQELRDAGAAFVSLGMRKGLADPRGWIRFHRFLKQQAPDVVHAHLPHAAWMARWSRLGAPVRVVVDTLHSSSTGTWGRRLGYRWSAWLTDKVSAVSQAVADAHLSAHMVSEDQLAILPNGVDLGVWRPDQPDQAVRTAVRREFGLGDGFVWFAAGRLDPVKDYPSLLRAMAMLPPSARLVIAGAGPCEAELRRLTADLNLGPRVRFLGFEPDVRRWMQAADGYVLSSRWEGLPMGLLEAAACALSAVATDVPGSREVVVDGQTGWLTPACDSAALANTMTHAMVISPQDRKVIGAHARQMVMERFSLTAVLDQWEALYLDLLQQNQRPRRCGRSG